MRLKELFLFLTQESRVFFHCLLNLGVHWFCLNDICALTAHFIWVFSVICYPIFHPCGYFCYKLLNSNKIDQKFVADLTDDVYEFYKSVCYWKLSIKVGEIYAAIIMVFVVAEYIQYYNIYDLNLGQRYIALNYFCWYDAFITSVLFYYCIIIYSICSVLLMLHACFISHFHL